MQLVPPLDPANVPPDSTFREVYSSCPDGRLVSGIYIKWQGHFYSGYRIGSDMWIEHRVKGRLPDGWIPIPGSFNKGSVRSSFGRNVPTDEVEQYVSEP